ncbi:hypothetical protein [Qipengyuania flava]|uniref:hypothetical protein n=1 Tax=Qipengyuania flava TaxID=192812 RepID=UPI00273D6BC2|nr:hypothetical protein [Qipengyuania flava]
MGCTRVSPACDNCYAADMMDARYGRVKWGGVRSGARLPRPSPLLCGMARQPRSVQMRS